MRSHGFPVIETILIGIITILLTGLIVIFVFGMAGNIGGLP